MAVPLVLDALTAVPDVLETVKAVPDPNWLTLSRVPVVLPLILLGPAEPPPSPSNTHPLPLELQTKSCWPGKASVTSRSSLLVKHRGGMLAVSTVLTGAVTEPLKSTIPEDVS